MAASEPFSPPQPNVETTSNLPGKAIQVVQGCYYLFTGTIAVVGVANLIPSVHPGPYLTHYWIVRLAGVALMAFGFFLLRSGMRPEKPFISGGVGFWVAITLFVVELGAVMLGGLPNSYLLDVGIELMFVVWWVLLMFSRADEGIGENTTLPARP